MNPLLMSNERKLTGTGKSVLKERVCAVSLPIDISENKKMALRKPIELIPKGRSVLPLQSERQFQHGTLRIEHL